MSTLLASIFSRADALKRTLADAIAEPKLHAARSIGYGIDRLTQLNNDIYTAQSRSVLVSPEQKEAADKRATDAMLNTVAGAGIIVPFGSVPGITRSMVKEADELLKTNPIEAFRKYGVHRQAVSGSVVQNVSDRGHLIPASALTKTEKGVRLKAGNEGRMSPFKVDELINLDRYPPDLAEYMRSLTVHSVPGPGAAFYQSGKIDLGRAKTPEQLTSVLLHELNHGSQYLYDMPRGGNPQQFFQDYGKFSTAQLRAQQLFEQLQSKGKLPTTIGNAAATTTAKTKQELLDNPATVNSILTMLRRVDDKAHSQYENIAGEVESRLVQRYFEQGDNLRSISPSTVIATELGIKPTAIINPKDVTLMPKVDADPITQSLIKLLLE